ncbi:MAG: CAP domain-containing protein [Oscillospiraceae bacterium]|nr:CAP domain-containing protein [Oscillospiraceae bacterium]
MTNTKRIVALALALVMLATIFTSCTKKETVNTETGETVSQSETVTLSAEVPNEDTVEDESQSEEPTNEITDNVTEPTQTEQTTKKAVSTGNTETTTKKATTPTGSSSGSSNKGTSATSCSHSWSEYKWGTTEATYADKYRTCSKCGKTENWRDCNHSFGSWADVRLKVQERVCSKCGWEESRDADNADKFMGNKSEYLEFLFLVNEARRAEGLNEVKYLDVAQDGANIRAVEITENFSHTRPNGKRGISAVGECITKANITNLAACNENIVGSATKTPKQAFDSWMNSAGHRANILSDGISYIVVARCDGYWAMIGVAIVE